MFWLTAYVYHFYFDVPQWDEHPKPPLGATQYNAIHIHSTNSVQNNFA